MTISLLLVVMRILTVTTLYKLEIFPVSGAPAAQQAWGWHRLGLPAFLPSHEPVWNTQARLELQMPPDLTASREQRVRQDRREISLSPAPPGAQDPAPCGAAWQGEPRGGGWGQCWRKERRRPHRPWSYLGTSCHFRRNSHTAAVICQL